MRNTVRPSVTVVSYSYVFIHAGRARKKGKKKSIKKGSTVLNFKLMNRINQLMHGMGGSTITRNE